VRIDHFQFPKLDTPEPEGKLDHKIFLLFWVKKEFFRAHLSQGNLWGLPNWGCACIGGFAKLMVFLFKSHLAINWRLIAN
jgi:hypothetical protein